MDFAADFCADFCCALLVDGQGVRVGLRRDTAGSATGGAGGGGAFIPGGAIRLESFNGVGPGGIACGEKFGS